LVDSNVVLTKGELTMMETFYQGTVEFYKELYILFYGEEDDE